MHAFANIYTHIERSRENERKGGGANMNMELTSASFNLHTEKITVLYLGM